MHIGGACSNDVVRGDDPSALGHGVSPLIDAPGATTGSDTGGFGFTLAVGPLDGGTDALVVDVDPVAVVLAFGRVAAKMPPTVASTTTTTTPMPMRRRRRTERCIAAACASCCARMRSASRARRLRVLVELATGADATGC